MRSASEPLTAGWLTAGWLTAGWLTAGWLTAGWLTAGWLTACWLTAGWLTAGWLTACWLTAGWLTACWLTAGWLTAGWLTAGWLTAGWLTAGWREQAPNTTHSSFKELCVSGHTLQLPALHVTSDVAHTLPCCQFCCNRLFHFHLSNHECLTNSTHDLDWSGL